MSDSTRADLTRTLIRRWMWSVLAVAAGVSGGYLYGALAPSTYTAQTFLVAVAQTGGDVTSATGFATAYTRLATQPTVLDAASADSGIPAGTLRSAVSASISPDAPVISISGSARTPAAAAADANAVASALTALAAAHTAETTVRLSLLTAAVPPAEPSSPSKILDAALGGGAGLLLASLGALAGGGTAARRRAAETGPSETAPSSAPAEPQAAADNHVPPLAERTVP